MVLFLDFDGVLHTLNAPDHRRFQHLNRLETLLRRFPSVDLVISSTWREMHGLDQLRTFFSSDMAARVIDTTGHAAELNSTPDRLIGYPREAEIFDWMRTHRSASNNWLALDDSPWLFSPFSPNLITVNAHVGIDDGVLATLELRFVAGGLRPSRPASLT